MHVDRCNSCISDTRIFSPLLGRHTKYGALSGCGFVCTIKSVMDWRDKDYQTSAPKKAPVLIHKAYYFRTATRHECPVQRSLNSYSYDRFGSLAPIQLRLSKMTSY